MRVISGTYRGRKLKAPSGLAVRPTSDRVRESLFSVIRNHIGDANVLDLFAGSGALGIEALSRGAAQATFVDESATAIKTVRENLAKLGIEGALVHRMTAQQYLRNAKSAGTHYDLIFVDPPYRLAKSLGEVLSECLSAVLSPGSVVVTESGKQIPLELNLPLTDERRYGDTLIRIYVTK